ncbi:MAG: serine/threonine-protein kinase [Myxococcota bacterium]
MARPRMHEVGANDGGDAADDSGKTVSLPARPEDGVDQAKDSADLTTQVEGATNQANLAPDDAHDGDAQGSRSATKRDYEMAVLKARVAQALFERPVRSPMLGRYVVLDTLGQGGMGTVFEAFDRTLDRKVAIKVLHAELGRDDTARLLREAQAMAKLSHPNVVPVFEVNTVDRQTFVVMERVQGPTLRAWMRQDPRPDWRQCIEVFIQAGQGLAAAHAAGLVHRDFKPSNVLLGDEGRARVLDFGLARRIEVEATDSDRLGHLGRSTDNAPSLASITAAGTPSGATRAEQTVLDQTLTKTGMVVGTPAYMPPEAMMGREIDARSDQFSFCVSLYEAVYGERPFAGDTLNELTASMMREGVRPIPTASPVPERLRTIVLRGLALDPVKRWPSMEALLDELRMLVAPHTRRWMVMGVTTGLMALAGGLALGQYAEVKDRCTGAQAQIDGIWDDARREQVQAALLGTERPFAASTWERIEPKLDAYADAWIQAHTAACRATSVHREQPQEVLDLGMHCLGERLTVLRATVDMLADADAELTTKAIELVDGLPPLTRCADLEWLQQQNQRVPPPEDPEVAEAVQAQRAYLANITVMQKAGRYAEALEAAQEVVKQAQELGYPPLRAEALHRRGELRTETGKHAEAEEDLRHAYALAISHQHDLAALNAASALTYVVGYQLVRHAEGQQWGEMMALPLAQRSGEPLQEARSLSTLGIVLLSRKDHQSAQHHFERALAIYEKAVGPDHPHVAASLNSLGAVFNSMGDYENAQHHFERALAIWEKARGPDHPHVAYSLIGLGAVFSSKGDYEDARHHYERALAIWEKALDPDHPSVATSLNNLGATFSSMGDYENAQHHYERALAMMEKTRGPDHPDVATSLHNLGAMFSSMGDYENARHHYERALTILEKALGPDHPQVAYSLVGMAKVALKMNNSMSARAHAERAFSIREAATVAPELLAEARFILARALWSEHSERARARELAKQAREVWLEAESKNSTIEEYLAAIDAWLATHRVKP